jgi:hypothetical protein
MQNSGLARRKLIQRTRLHVVAAECPRTPQAGVCRSHGRAKITRPLSDELTLAATDINVTLNA